MFGKKRIFSTEIGVYNPERGEWSKIKSLEGRRYHASTRFMHYIVIYGGVNDKEEYLGDITVVNLQNSLSVPLNYRLEEDKMGIAYHRIASTMELDSKKRGVTHARKLGYLKRWCLQLWRKGQPKQLR